MSYHVLPTYTLVVCDLCGSRGPACHPDWRHMRASGSGAPIHLCRECRPEAHWCASHQVYHRADDLHRLQCADCGGLYTIRFSSDVQRCPSCQRTFVPPTHGGSAPRRQREQRHRNLLVKLRALMLLR